MCIYFRQSERDRARTCDSQSERAMEGRECSLFKVRCLFSVRAGERASKRETERRFALLHVASKQAQERERGRERDRDRVRLCMCCVLVGGCEWDFSRSIDLCLKA